jgi:hypothetical protein
MVAVPMNSNKGMKMNLSFRMIGKVRRFMVVVRYKLFMIRQLRIIWPEPEAER